MNSSNNINLLSALLLFSASTPHMSAMELPSDDIEKNVSCWSSPSSTTPESNIMDELNTVIEGDLFLYPYTPTYADGLNEREGFTESVKDQLKLQDNDMMVRIWAASEESSNWSAHGHWGLGKNIFPLYLPYKLF
jgi:hypothetical protein